MKIKSIGIFDTLWSLKAEKRLFDEAKRNTNPAYSNFSSFVPSTLENEAASQQEAEMLTADKAFETAQIKRIPCLWCNTQVCIVEEVQAAQEFNSWQDFI